MTLDLSAARYFVKQYMNRGSTMEEAFRILNIPEAFQVAICHDYQFLNEVSKPKSFGDKIKDLLNTVAATGLDLERAATIEGLSSSELDFLQNDELFMLDYNKTMARYEQNLLRDVAECKELNVKRGNSTEARWLLEKQFGSRYGNKSSVEVSGYTVPEPVAVERE